MIEKVTDRVTNKVTGTLKESDKRIKLLKDSGLIIRIGSDKKGYWKLI